MAITLRNTKGSALTHAELDGNFTDLNGRVLDSDGIRALVDSDYVQLRQADIYRDSGFVTNIVDSAYVEARISAHYTGFDSDFGTKTTTDLTEGTNLYYTTARHDSDFTTSLAAASLGYTTDSASLWNGSAPTTVDSALDRIALVVRTLNGGTGA